MYLSRWSLRLPRRAIRSYSVARKPPGVRNSVDRARWSKSSLNKYPSRSPSRPENSPAQSQGEPSSTNKISDALRQNADNSQNSLVAPVHIPEDPHGIIKERHPASSLLANSSIVVQRQLEMMNVLVGFEQANRYIIMDAAGNHIGYLAEQEHGVGSTIYRQVAKTHRSFTTHVFDREEKEVLRFYRPFSWINSRIRVYDALGASEPSYSGSTALQNTSTGSIINQSSAQVSQIPLDNMSLIGEAQQQWAPLRRKYNLFLRRNAADMQTSQDNPLLTSGNLPLSDSKSLQTLSPESADQGKGFFQFAYVNEPFLSWDFSLLSESNQLLGSVNRNFAGFAREIFTDTGVYALRMDAAALAAEPRHLISQTGANASAAAASEQAENTIGMTLDQRAVMLATAVSIDFDYFSRHSSGVAGGGFFPIWFPMGGEAAGGAAAGEAGAAGAAEAAGTGVANAGESLPGMAGRGLGTEASGGAVAGAGTMAGYEAMQQGRGRAQQDDASPTNNEPFERGGAQSPQAGSQGQGQDQEEVWGEDWSSGRDQSGSEGGVFGGGEGGEGVVSKVADWFSDFFD
ncbi:MAG: hypothetical protein M1822_002816 [Bathelium mastoideum]|nr:MAG: hypothetical protein M1822_002816 [Bathelium mastoideum]